MLEAPVAAKLLGALVANAVKGKDNQDNKANAKHFGFILPPGSVREFVVWEEVVFAAPAISSRQIKYECKHRTGGLFFAPRD